MYIVDTYIDAFAEVLISFCQKRSFSFMQDFHFGFIVCTVLDSIFLIADSVIATVTPRYVIVV